MSAVATSYQVGWIDYTLQNIRNSDNIKYKTQKPCNEDQILKSTDLRQTQRFIESWSISTALVPYNLSFSKVHKYYNNNIISKLYCTHRTHVAITKKRATSKKTNKQTTIKQTKTETTYNNPCLLHRCRSGNYS